ncbi:MAG: hypothetical protein ACLTJ8_00335 [Veillonella atypica]
MLTKASEASIDGMDTYKNDYDATVVAVTCHIGACYQYILSLKIVMVVWTKDEAIKANFTFTTGSFGI